MYESGQLLLRVSIHVYRQLYQLCTFRSCSIGYLEFRLEHARRQAIARPLHGCRGHYSCLLIAIRLEREEQVRESGDCECQSSVASWRDLCRRSLCGQGARREPTEYGKCAVGQNSIWCDKVAIGTDHSPLLLPWLGECDSCGLTLRLHVP